MPRELPPKIVAIVGPTASGKSALAVKIALKFGGEIISADSRQVYRGLNIGSGKITRKEARGVPHRLLDIASPKQIFTVAAYQKLARRAVEKIFARGKVPVIVGGTGFYIDTLLYGYALPGAKPHPKLRERLEKKSADELFVQLKKLDPSRARTIDRRNKRRLVRALEIVLQTKKSIPPLEKRSRYATLKIGVRLSKQQLRKRIKDRLRRRLRRGMIQEVQALHEKGLSWRRLDDLGLEYRHVSRYLRGLITEQEMRETLEKEIWRYAKRQMTWWRKDKDILWLKSMREVMRAVRNFLR